MHRASRPLVALTAGVGAIVVVASTALASVPIKVVSQDPYTNTSSYHKTEVEPDTYSFGSTIVSGFQMGRFTDGGASNNGFATSTDNGQTWTDGGLPGTTIYAIPPGPFKRATDPSVAYDAEHDVWLFISLASMANSGFDGDFVIASRSTDGGLTWGNNPITVRQATGFEDFDKTFVGCDNWPSSPNFGNCYAQWDDFGNGNTLELSRSTDGGVTWTASSTPNSTVIGGIPLAQPSGKVVVPIDDGFESSAESFVSTNGGQSYTGPFNISSFQTSFVGGQLRAPNLISADVDNTGKIYVVWYDCRFRSGCSSNDIVMSTSTDGQNWGPVRRIPIDPTSSTVDHFLPGIAVDPATGGATAHLALTYWSYQNANCSICRLNYAIVESNDGGFTWTSPVRIRGPFTTSWYPNTTQGYMVGDYSSVSWVTGGWQTVFAGAQQSPCSLGVNNCKVAMIAPSAPLAGTDGAMHRVSGVVRTNAGHVPKTTLKHSR